MLCGAKQRHYQGWSGLSGSLSPFTPNWPDSHSQTRLTVHTGLHIYNPIHMPAYNAFRTCFQLKETKVIQQCKPQNKRHYLHPPPGRLVPFPNRRHHPNQLPQLPHQPRHLPRPVSLTLCASIVDLKSFQTTPDMSFWILPAYTVVLADSLRTCKPARRAVKADICPPWCTKRSKSLPSVGDRCRKCWHGILPLCLLSSDDLFNMLFSWQQKSHCRIRSMTSVADFKSPTIPLSNLWSSPVLRERRRKVSLSRWCSRFVGYCGFVKLRKTSQLVTDIC